MRNMAHPTKYNSEARGWFTCAIGFFVVILPAALIIYRLLEWAAMRPTP